MTGSEMMIAVGNISDRYIEECAKATDFGKRRIKKFICMFSASAAAVLCAVTAAFVIKTGAPSLPGYSPVAVSPTPREDFFLPICFNVENGISYGADPKNIIVTEVPDGYTYAGTVTNTGNKITKNAFEGSAGGDVYLSEDGETAYFQASRLKKIDGKAPFILCRKSYGYIKPVFFYYNGKKYVNDLSTVIKVLVPEGYTYAGAIVKVKNPQADFEGNASGNFYMSDDGKTAYFQASTLKTHGGKATLILCVCAEED